MTVLKDTPSARKHKRLQSAGDMLMCKLQDTQKNMKKNKKLSLKQRIITSAMLMVAVGSILPLSGFTYVAADSVSDQIRDLQAQNAENQNIVSRLQNEAASYQDAISSLQIAINALQQKINDNLAQQAELQRKIEDGQRELEHQRKVLGENIKAMYVEGQITTIEMLATSKNLSDFVDKEEYRSAVERKVQDTLKKIAKLQNEMKEQKVQIEALLKEQQQQRAELASSRAEQNRLLSLNKSQQADYNQRTQQNQAKINELIAQQRRANRSIKGGIVFIRVPGSISGPSGIDDYPYKNSGFSMSTMPGCGHADPRTGQRDSTDRWGYCTRQCVSYTAWAVERSGRNAPEGWSHAKNWANRAPDSWVFYDPKPGDVAISTSGTWGHAMYVEKVDGNRILVSQYNADLDGEFSVEWRTFR